MITWTCHVCGDERPDDKISVFKITETVRGITVGQNVRYCNDRAGCAGGAPEVADRRMRVLRGENDVLD